MQPKKSICVPKKTGLPSPLSVLMSSYPWVGPDYGLVVCESIVDYITCECFSFDSQYVFTCLMVVVVTAMLMTMMMMKDICERHELTRWPDDGDVGGAIGNGDNDDEGYL